jgi:hypothetical protein
MIMSRRKNKGQRPRKLDGGVIQQIRGIIAEYRYKLARILDEECKLTYNPETETLMLRPLYRHAEFTTEGDCGELSLTARKKIRAKFPNVHVYRVSGAEPKFFPRGPHMFLLVSAYDALRGVTMASQPEHHQAVREADPILVDPGFRYVARFRKTQYTLLTLMNDKLPGYYPVGQVLLTGQALPILYSRGELMQLTHGPEYPSTLAIEFRGARKPVDQRYDLRSPDLDKRVGGNEEQMQFVAALRQKELIHTTDMLELSLEDSVVIK